MWFTEQQRFFVAAFWEADADHSDPVLLVGNLDQYQQSKKSKTRKSKKICTAQKLVTLWEIKRWVTFHIIGGTHCLSYLLKQIKSQCKCAHFYGNVKGDQA